MARMVNCHAGFFPWNCFYGVRSNSVAPESDSGSSSGLYSVVCLYERLMLGSQDIKRGKSVVTVPFLTASLLGHLFSHMVRMVDCHAEFFPLELLEKKHTWEDPLYTSRGHRLLFPIKFFL